MAAEGITSLLRRLEVWAREEPHVIALYLFGSHAVGNPHPGSDVDVGVLARADSPRERLWRMEDRWSSELAPREGPEVDLMLLNVAPLPIRFEVITNGRLLWTDDISQVAEFESLTLRRYWDLKPILESYWQAAVDQLMEAENEAERRQHEAALGRVGAVHRRV